LNKGAHARQRNFFDVCSKCKTAHSCCNDTTPPITPERRKIIDSYLKEKGLAVASPFERTEYTFPRLTRHGYCVFQNRRTKKCLIHSVKPETCVAGPITFDVNFKTGKIEWFIKKENICQLAGAVFQDKLLLQLHLEKAKGELLCLVAQLSSEELRAILKKDEPETFKIGEDALEEPLLCRLTG